VVRKFVGAAAASRHLRAHPEKARDTESDIDLAQPWRDFSEVRDELAMMLDILDHRPEYFRVVAGLCKRRQMTQHPVTGMGIEAPADGWPDKRCDKIAGAGRCRIGPLNRRLKQCQALRIEAEIDALGSRKNQVLKGSEMIVDRRDIGARPTGDRSHRHVIGVPSSRQQLLARSAQFLSRMAHYHTVA